MILTSCAVEILIYLRFNHTYSPPFIPALYSWITRTHPLLSPSLLRKEGETACNTAR